MNPRWMIVENILRIKKWERTEELIRFALTQVHLI